MIAWSVRGEAWAAARDGVCVLLAAFLLSPYARRWFAAREISHATSPLTRAPATTKRRPAPAQDDALSFPNAILEPEWREKLSTFLDVQDYGVVACYCVRRRVTRAERFT